jgi:hypothetical protein
MISAKECRLYAAECRLRSSSSDASTQRSLEQSIMALNWSALADEIDRENAKPYRRNFLRWVSPLCSQTSNALHTLVIRLAKPLLNRREPC